MTRLTCCSWSHGLQLLSGSLAKGQLFRVSRQSANDKGDNEIISGAVNRSPDIYLTTEKNLEKPQLRELDEGCATGHCLKWGPLHLKEFCRITKDVRKGEGKGGINFKNVYSYLIPYTFRPSCGECSNPRGTRIGNEESSTVRNFMVYCVHLI
jgi:hypothetical protein